MALYFGSIDIFYFLNRFLFGHLFFSELVPFWTFFICHTLISVSVVIIFILFGF